MAPRQTDEFAFDFREILEAGYRVEVCCGLMTGRAVVVE